MINYRIRSILFFRGKDRKYKQGPKVSGKVFILRAARFSASAENLAARTIEGNKICIFAKIKGAMTTYAIHFKDEDKEKINRLLDFVRSLDFVQSVELFPTGTTSSTEESPPPQSSEGFLPLSEIKRLYPDEWVLLDKAHKTGATILGGVVLLHEADKRLFALKARDFIKKDAHLTHFFTGELPHRAQTGLARKIVP